MLSKMSQTPVSVELNVTRKLLNADETPISQKDGRNRDRCDRSFVAASKLATKTGRAPSGWERARGDNGHMGSSDLE
jgi:hypothetical protein